MKVLVMIKGDGADEDKVAPTDEMFATMNAYNEQLVNAGIMLGGEGLRPSSKGAKVVCEGGETSVVDGPFTESKEIIAGYWIWQVSSLDEAVEWAKRCPSTARGCARCSRSGRSSRWRTSRRVADELREQDDRLAEEIEGASTA